MTNDDWKTLRVPPDAYADAKAQKEAAGRTWGEQIVRPDGDDYVYAQVSGFDADGEHNLRAVLRDVLSEVRR